MSVDDYNAGTFALRAIPELSTGATHRAPYNERLDRLSADLDAKGYRPAPPRHRASV